MRTDYDHCSKEIEPLSMRPYLEYVSSLGKSEKRNLLISSRSDPFRQLPVYTVAILSPCLSVCSALRAM